MNTPALYAWGPKPATANFHVICIHKQPYRRHYNTFRQKYKKTASIIKTHNCLQLIDLSLEHDILRALSLYSTGTFYDLLKIVLGWILASCRTLGCNAGGLHICPICLNAGKSHPRTLYACRPLLDIYPCSGTKHLLH